MTFMEGWEGRMVRMPGRFTATPQEILEFLRENFAEDRVLHFLWDIGDSAVQEAAESVVKDYASDRRPGVYRHVKEAVDAINPGEGGGHWPESLLCYRHGPVDGVQAQPCPGAPECHPGAWKERDRRLAQQDRAIRRAR